jgi:Zn-dependent alcohol dehydrogenase
MKAMIFRETGEPNSVLQLADIPTPPLAPGEALVRVLLSPIHVSDLHMVRGRYGYQPELPASPGIEGVGIVEAVGPGVQDPMVGTRVVFIGTWTPGASWPCLRLGGEVAVNPLTQDLFRTVIEQRKSLSKRKDLQRRHVKIDLFKCIGKESNSLKSVYEGMVHSEANVYTDYADPRRPNGLSKFSPH